MRRPFCRQRAFDIAILTENTVLTLVIMTLSAVNRVQTPLRTISLLRVSRLKEKLMMQQ